MSSLWEHKDTGLRGGYKPSFLEEGFATSSALAGQARQIFAQH